MDSESWGDRVCQRLDLVDHPGCGTVSGVPGCDQVRDKQGIVRRQQTVEVANARLLAFNEVEILTRGRIGVNERIFFIVSPAKIELAMEPKKEVGIQAVRKARRSKDDVIGPFTFMACERIRERLECDKRLNASTANYSAGAIFGIVSWETKILNWPPEIGSSDEIQFVCARRFICIHKAIDAIVLKIEVTRGRVE